LRVNVWGTGQTGLATAKEMIRQGHEARLVGEHAPKGSLEILCKIADEGHMAWAYLLIPQAHTQEGAWSQRIEVGRAF
jgi:hypothetical protein